MDETSENITSEETENKEMLIAINKAIQAMATKFGEGGTEVKGSVADLIKLLQLRKELEGDRPRRISARWIEECKTNFNV